MVADITLSKSAISLMVNAVTHTRRIAMDHLMLGCVHVMGPVSYHFLWRRSRCSHERSTVMSKCKHMTTWYGICAFNFWQSVINLLISRQVEHPHDLGILDCEVSVIF